MIDKLDVFQQQKKWLVKIKIKFNLSYCFN